MKTIILKTEINWSQSPFGLSSEPVEQPKGYERALGPQSMGERRKKPTCFGKFSTNGIFCVPTAVFRIIGPTRRQSGISMVEILVALTLSILLTLVIGQIYISNSQAYRLQEAQSRIQENGRFALEFLSKDVRRVGSMGCLSVLNKPLVIANSSPSITPATSIQGYDADQTTSYPVPSSTSATWNPTAPSGVGALAGTDILSIQFAEPCGGHLQTPITGMTPSPSSNLSSTNTCSITAGTTELVLSDCSQSEIFRSDSNSTISISGTSNNTQDHFTYSHGLDAEVMVVRAYTYFIQSFPGNGEPTLYRLDNIAATPNPQPLIEGIEDMQLHYGVDLNADWSVDQYVTAGNVSNWANVIAIRVDLVIRSTGLYGTNLTNTTTACNGVTVTDTRLRRCYSFTINLRNPKA